VNSKRGTVIPDPWWQTRKTLTRYPNQNGTYKRWQRRTQLYILKYFFCYSIKKHRFIFNNFFENRLLAIRVQSATSLLCFRTWTASAGGSGGVPGATTATVDVTAPAPVIPSSASWVHPRSATQLWVILLFFYVYSVFAIKHERLKKVQQRISSHNVLRVLFITLNRVAQPLWAKGRSVLALVSWGPKTKLWSEFWKVEYKKTENNIYLTSPFVSCGLILLSSELFRIVISC